MIVHLTVPELLALEADPGATRPWVEPAPRVVVAVDLDTVSDRQASLPDPAGLGVVVVGVTATDDPGWWPAWCDVIATVGDGTLEGVEAMVDRAPVASLSLALLLRRSARLAPGDGLFAESACYAALQAGPEFARWRSTTPRRPAVPEGDPVLAVRDGGTLRLTLHRPGRRNALDVGMRDALVELLTLVRLDPTIERVVLDGSGPDFCSGGDLDEFGSTSTPAAAHLVRLSANVGPHLLAVADRVTASLHGACIGAGIELAAFAGRVVAAQDVSIGLPEVSMGLIPGAGGSVSLTRRIGRHRTCRLALTGERIDATTARWWGLVDELH